MIASELTREYRRVRRQQREAYPYVAWQGKYPGHTRGLAQAAVDVARSELELKAAEYAGRIRFDWSEYEDGWRDALDQDFESDEQRKAYEAQLHSGELVVERCVALVPAGSAFLRAFGIDSDDVDDWAPAASLSAIDHRPGDDYGREVERELASEAAVIA